MKYTPEGPKSLPETGFQPYNLKYGKSGTSMVYQIGDHRRKGRYSLRDAHSKRIFNDIYTKTKWESEEKLKVLIGKSG